MTQVQVDNANAVNIREIGQYDTVELLTGQQWFTTGDGQTKRFTFRQVYVLPATAAGATTTIAHGITGQTLFTKIYGSCITNVVDYRPIPYASVSAVNKQIEINVDTTNINIINGASSPNITSGIIVLEYLKN